MKTTLYVPDDLKRAIHDEAARRGTSEAEVVRESLRASLLRDRPRPRGGLFAGTEPIAERAEELLEDFGTP
ncbi:MAG: CopG family transcriptional regulator [Nocardioidaceae bacterium]